MVVISEMTGKVVSVPTATAIVIVYVYLLLVLGYWVGVTKSSA